MGNFLEAAQLYPVSITVIDEMEKDRLFPGPGGEVRGASMNRLTAFITELRRRSVHALPNTIVTQALLTPNCRDNSTFDHPFSSINRLKQVSFYRTAGMSLISRSKLLIKQMGPPACAPPLVEWGTIPERKRLSEIFSLEKGYPYRA